MNQQSLKYTSYGILAILLWSTTVAFSRNLAEKLGTLTSAMFIYLLAGLLACLYSILIKSDFKRMLSLPLNYLLACGSLFGIYILSLYLAIGMASTRPQVIIIGLINYLWPALSLVFSIPILKNQARSFLPIGVLLAMTGIWLGYRGSNSHLDIFSNGLSTIPYLLALIAAICWGLYSNLSRLWNSTNEIGGVPLFLLWSGLLLGTCRLFVSETTHWSPEGVLEIIYMASFPAMIAYILWDVAVRKGNLILVASFSYITPLLSTLISTIVLGLPITTSFWMAALFVIAGAAICKVAVLE